MADSKRGGRRDGFSGASGDDFTKYGKTGVFPKVMDALNAAFRADRIDATKLAWDQHIASIGGIANYKFGMFSAVILKDLFTAEGGSSSGKDYPKKSEWAGDSWDASVVKPALAGIIGALRDNLSRAKPLPMSFVVVKSPDEMHHVEQKESADVIDVTMFCPAPKE